MATIYRFIIEQRGGGNGGNGEGRTPKIGKTKSPSKKGRDTVTLLGSMKGGVEHNRKMRAINPILNIATHGAYEKATRVGRAGLGLVKFDAATGAFAGFSGTAVAIIVAFILKELYAFQQREIERVRQLNTQNYKQLENGVGAIHGQYSISVSAWDGSMTYNQNK